MVEWVGAVVDGTGAVGEPAQAVGVGGVRGNPLHRGMHGTPTAAGHDADLLTPLGEQQRRRGAGWAGAHDHLE